MSGTLKFLLFSSLLAVAVATAWDPKVIALDMNSTVTEAPAVAYDMLTQVRDIDSDNRQGGEFHYICRVGTPQNLHPMCNGQDSMGWPTPHDVELRLRCPRAGTGQIVRYAQVDVWISSNDLQCAVVGGGIGRGYIELQVNARRTTICKYVANMYF